jgi:glycosyltransferase involved in cell wall biosynthesis/SAM-dependent methyltransferase
MTPTFSNTQSPLISVIITCYNHGQYLADAIESVLQQRYKPVEIIVVDDGSKDDTRTVAQRFAGVKYVYQKNRGLSAARNTGIEHSTGELLLFLDADDWLLPDALTTNYSYLNQDPELAFTSGGHIKVNAQKELLEEVKTYVTEDHYQWLLQLNYIGMHAAVLFRRWAFQSLRYDPSLKACEDYDVYLKIAREHPVFHHTSLLTAYRIHQQNMSRDLSLMLRATMNVLSRQQPGLRNETEQACLQKGMDIWKSYYCPKIFEKLTTNLWERGDKGSKAETDELKRYDTVLYAQYVEQVKWYKEAKKKEFGSTVKKSLKKVIPTAMLHWYRRQKRNNIALPQQGKINMGDLARTTPFSTEFGFDRGGALDRYYIENFLQQQAPIIKGRVLEIGDNEYTLRFGGAAVTQSDILHVNEYNPKATFVGDLSNAPHLPDAAFDCIILTQTLHLIYNYNEALQTCLRILKPGGSLLLTSPGITHIDQGEWKKVWLWSFTDNAINRMLSQIFPPENVMVETYGNVLAATAFLYGMGLPELTREQLDTQDPHYQVIITAKATKKKDEAV